jgi:hypothetical protein
MRPNIFVNANGRQPEGIANKPRQSRESKQRKRQQDLV